MKYLYLSLGLAGLSLGSCTNRAVNLTGVKNNYRVVWNNDSNFILLAGYLVQSHKGDDVYNKYYKHDIAWIKDNHSDILFTEDTTIRGNSTLTDKYSTISVTSGNSNKVPDSVPYIFRHPVFPQHLYLPMDPLLSGLQTSLDTAYGPFTFKYLSASNFVIAADCPLNLDFVSNKIGYLDIAPSDNKIPPMPLELRIEDLDGNHPVIENSYSSVIIYHKQIGRINLSGCTLPMLILHDCEADSNTSFNAAGLDSICLKSLDMKGHQHFSLQWVRREDDKEVVICIEKTDISKIDLDYTKFRLVSNREEYLNYNDWYSAMDKNYLDMIANQGKAHNEGGKIKATIEYDQFRDQQSIFGSPLVWIKTWWNNYGFDKFRIVYDTLELFLLFIGLNSLFLRPLVTSVYVIEGAKKAYEEAVTQPVFKRRLQKFTLCVLFTGFLFFGLKLDLDKFKLDSIPLVVLVIGQFVIGLICLGYLANLIIAK